MDGSRLEVSKLKKEISGLLKNKNETMVDLDTARKLISEQMEKIKKLEAEVKRLSKSSNQKKT